MNDDRSPLERILGVPDDAGPFAMLNLDVSELQDAEIIDALTARMSQVASHPLSESADGNEVRLALHAAAARLLDPAVRAAMLARAGVRATEPVRQPTPPSDPLLALGPQALLVVASEGGWNDKAFRRLAMLAHARGIPSESVPLAVRSLMQQPAAADTPAAADAERRGSVPRTSASSTASSRAIDGASLIVALVAGLALAVLVWTWLSLSRAATDRREQAALAAAEAEPEAAREIQPALETQAEQMAETPTVVASPEEPDWLAAAVGMRDSAVEIDRETLAVILDGLAKSWLIRSESERALTLTVVVDLIYRMSQEQAAEAIDALAELANGSDLVRSAWACGMLARLSQEKSLPRGVDGAILAALAQAIGPRVRTLDASFGQGVAALLKDRAARWSDSTMPGDETIDSWFVILDRLERIDEPLAGAALRDSLKTVLLSNRDLVSDRAVQSFIRRAGTALTLPEDRENASYVLGVLADPAVESATLSAFLAALRTQPSLAPTGRILDLAPTASTSRRAEVRQLLESEWFGKTETSWANDEFLRLARAHVDRKAPTDTIGYLAESVVSARLCAAAAAMLWSEDEQAETILGSLRSDVDALSRGLTPSVQGIDGSGGQEWARRYLEAKRNIPVRQSLLTELVRTKPTLGPVAAEVLVTEAVLGSPIQVRRLALDALPVFAQQPAFVNAVLELLPRMPRQRSAAGVVELAAARPLPSITDPSWPIQARRMVVARLLEILSGEGTGQQIDGLAALLADAYQRRIDRSPRSTPPTVAQLPELAVRMRSSWLAEARRVDRSGQFASRITANDRSLEGRFAMAEGDLHRFAAAQVSAFEAAALVILAERPERSAEIRGVEQRLAESRRRAGSVYQQIHEVELAMLRLWIIRMGAEL